MFGYGVLYFGNDFCKLEGYPDNIENISDKAAYIWEIITDNKYLRRGVAFNILNYIKEKFTGYSIYSCINTTNIASLKLHTKTGFIPLYEFSLDGEQYIMMELKCI